MTERHHIERYRTLEHTDTRGFTLLPSQGAAWALELSLESVRDLGTRSGLSCYSLLLHQRTGDAYAPQGTYRLVHESLGEQHVMVVPLGGDASARMRYEVIFN